MVCRLLDEYNGQWRIQGVVFGATAPQTSETPWRMAPLFSAYPSRNRDKNTLNETMLHIALNFRSSVPDFYPLLLSIEQ